MNRKKFISHSASAATAAMLSSLESFSLSSKPAFTINKNYELLILATNWGFDGSIDAYCAKVKMEGYDGIEIWWPMEQKSQDDLFAALKKNNLQVGFLCGGSSADPLQHLNQFKKMMDAAAKQNLQKPVYINCHSGRDHFSYDDNKKFIEYTISLSKDTGINILHETHRSRMLFAAHIAKQFMEKVPQLRLTLDISHWCNVHESLLADQPDAVNAALERTDHIHARIGHAEGPQVNDPRAPEWEQAVNAHFAWWDKVIERKKKNGERMTILTEFGPPAYMPTLPFTQQPVSDQWAINVYMMQLLRKRYG